MEMSEKSQEMGPMVSGPSNRMTGLVMRSRPLCDDTVTDDGLAQRRISHNNNTQSHAPGTHREHHACQAQLPLDVGLQSEERPRQTLLQPRGQCLQLGLQLVVVEEPQC